MDTDTKQRIVDAMRGSQTGAIVACALDLDRDALPRFVGKAICTSDGFLTCNFVDRDGISRHGAFVGSYGELEQNLIHAKRYLKTVHDIDVGSALIEAIEAWVAVDYR